MLCLQDKTRSNWALKSSPVRICMWYFIFVYNMAIVFVQLDTGSSGYKYWRFQTYCSVLHQIYIGLRLACPRFRLKTVQMVGLLLSGLSAKPKPDHHSHWNWRFQANLSQFYITYNISKCCLVRSAMWFCAFCILYSFCALHFLCILHIIYHFFNSGFKSSMWTAELIMTMLMMIYI